MPNCVLGLYTDLPCHNRNICFEIKRRSNKSPYIKQALVPNLRILPKIPRRGNILVALLRGSLIGRHTHLLNVSPLVSPLIMHGIIFDVLEVSTSVLLPIVLLVAI